MPITFFADHCISNSIIDGLYNTGYEVLRLKDHIPMDSPDSAVIAKAQELAAVLISLNGDFADIVSYPPENHGGVISLQVKNHPEIIPQLLSRLLNFLSMHRDKNYFTGRLVIVEPHRIRIRQ